jgi:hypothetical protein
MIPPVASLKLYAGGIFISYLTHTLNHHDTEKDIIHHTDIAAVGGGTGSGQKPMAT